MQKMRVGVLGSGVVGKALALGFIGLGHDVRIGSRDPQKLQGWVDENGPHASSGTFADAARFGDLLVLGTLGMQTVNAIELADPENFRNKVVIDATNPLAHEPDKLPQLAIGHTDSLGEQIQRAIPHARIVKAFNTVGNTLFVHPDLPGGPPSMFIAGNDADAKKIVSQVCEAFGWEVVDIGGIEGSRYLEPMCLTWVLHGIFTGTWGHAFKMLHTTARSGT